MKIVTAIRKFGLEYCDFPTMLWNVAVMLRVATLNVDPRHKKGIPFIYYITGPIIVCCFYYAYCFSTLWFVFVRSRETNDIVSAMVAFSISLCTEIGPTKLLFLILNRKQIRSLVEKCLELNSHLMPDSRFYKNLLKQMRTVKKRFILYGSLNIMNGVVYISQPLLTPGRHVLNENFPFYGLEPVLETPYYEISFVVGFISTCYVLHLTINITGLLVILTGYTESQMISLGLEFQELWNDANKHYQEIVLTDNSSVTVNKENAIKNAYVKRQLRNMINIHTANIQILRQTERAFRGALAAEFVLLILSLIAELLGGLENTYIQIPYGFALVGMDCLAGQRVLDAGVAFEEAVYDSKWENFNAENMRTVWMILINSQRPLNLSAGGLANLNLGILMTFARSAYSAYTALSSHVKH
ncbi:odorant receptor Or2-like [Galleria mellonella]|uniref:Odorant receptor n=1 Tax=Galleria mellonella TaxID=7137 RepID=A0A6J3C1F7_GALME|nr:odorant receptor Or2-like [Galleria mellonella]